MKRLFTLLMVAFVAFSCEMLDGLLDSKGEGLTFAEGTGLLAEFKAPGGSVTFKFTADIDWEATASEEWITVSPDKGEAGEGEIEVKVAENDSEAERTAVIELRDKSGDTLGEITIVQIGKSAEDEEPGSEVPNNEIWYATTDGMEFNPHDTTGFGANLIDNTYVNGKGVLLFDGDVTAIGESAFNSCSSLTSITIPDSVTTIGDYAFEYCRSLTSIIIPDSVTTIGHCAFSYCSSLTSINIPDSVTTIGWFAFYGCSSLTSITIPDSVTEIVDGAFCDCDSLTEFKCKFASEDGRCLIIDGTLNSFAPAGVTEYTIPDSVTKIGGWAFRECRSLTSVTIPDSVTEIGEGAFDGCSSLTSITIPDSVTEIGAWAFAYCSSLTSITIPDSVTTIGESAFCGCDSLIEFKGKFASEDGRCLIIDVTLNSFAPAGVTEYTIPDSVTEIGAWAFSHCSSLTSITIGNSVTTIGYGAFNGCSNLTSITIPDSVTTIGEHAFYWCSSLESVYCKPTTPPSIGNGVFDNNASDRKIYVPAESVEAYKTASYWSNYASDIVGYEF